MHLYHMTQSANQNSSCNHEAEHMASIKIPTVILFCKHTALCTCKLHTKFRIVVKGNSALFGTMAQMAHFFISVTIHNSEF